MVAENGFRDLSHADLQNVMQMCAKLHEADPAQSYITHCQSVLKKGLGNVHFSAERYQLKSFALLEQSMQTFDEKYLPLFYEHVLEHPYVERIINGSAPEVSMTHIEPALATFRNSTLYNEFYSQVQSQNQLWVGIQDGNELLTCIYSRETEYTECELTILLLIQPHIEYSWKNWKQVCTLKQELGILKKSIFQTPEKEAAAENLRNSIEQLTPRQRDVVELVAVGMDNQQVADGLKISVQTVKKHLQAIFQALEVQHRTQLAAKWHQAHSVSLY